MKTHDGKEIERGCILQEHNDRGFAKVLNTPFVMSAGGHCRVCDN